MEPNFPDFPAALMQRHIVVGGVLTRLPQQEWTRHVTDIDDIFFSDATLEVIGALVGSVVDWDCPVDTVWVSPDTSKELGISAGTEGTVGWSRTCHHGTFRVGQPVTIRTSSGWRVGEAILAVAAYNPKVYCRGYRILD